MGFRYKVLVMLLAHNGHVIHTPWISLLQEGYFGSLSSLPYPLIVMSKMELLQYIPMFLFGDKPVFSKNISYLVINLRLIQTHFTLHLNNKKLSTNFLRDFVGGFDVVFQIGIIWDSVLCLKQRLWSFYQYLLISCYF